MVVPHPIQYQGSKRALAPFILRYLPQTMMRLVEPFAGTAAISIAASIKRDVQSFWLNDYNKPLAELLSLIINHPHDIGDFYEKLWNEQNGDSIEHYYRVREKFNRTNDPRLFLYLLSKCVKGAVRYNSEGLFNQSPDKRRQGARPAKIRDHILGVSNLLKGKTIITAQDYRDVLANVTENDLVYMDPPYQGVCGERDMRYSSGIKFDEFVNELCSLNERNVPFLISYDGRTGNKSFGTLLPKRLRLGRIEIEAGPSTQATLLGRKENTYESLYLSPALMAIQGKKEKIYHHIEIEQLQLLEETSRYARSTRSARKIA